MCISQECSISAISYVFLYLKMHNFPPNCQISLEYNSIHGYANWCQNSAYTHTIVHAVESQNCVMLLL